MMKTKPLGAQSRFVFLIVTLLVLLWTSAYAIASDEPDRRLFGTWKGKSEHASGSIGIEDVIEQDVEVTIKKNGKLVYKMSTSYQTDKKSRKRSWTWFKGCVFFTVSNGREMKLCPVEDFRRMKGGYTSARYYISRVDLKKVDE